MVRDISGQPRSGRPPRRCRGPAHADPRCAKCGPATSSTFMSGIAQVVGPTRDNFDVKVKARQQSLWRPQAWWRDFLTTRAIVALVIDRQIDFFAHPGLAAQRSAGARRECTGRGSRPARRAEIVGGRVAPDLGDGVGSRRGSPGHDRQDTSGSTLLPGWIMPARRIASDQEAHSARRHGTDLDPPARSNAALRPALSRRGRPEQTMPRVTTVIGDPTGGYPCPAGDGLHRIHDARTTRAISMRFSRTQLAISMDNPALSSPCWAANST